MEAFVFPEHSEWTQEFAKMAKLDRLGSFQLFYHFNGRSASVPPSESALVAAHRHLERFGGLEASRIPGTDLSRDSFHLRPRTGGF